MRIGDKMPIGYYHIGLTIDGEHGIIKIDDTSGITNPLELNGVSEGDIILKINDLPATWANLTTALKLTFPGDEILLELYGKDSNKEVLVKTVASN